MARLIGLRHRWRRSIALAITLLIVGFVATSMIIGGQVRATMAAAQKAQPGNGVAALMAVANSAGAPVAERNRAIWALGQLGVRAALPMLSSLSTGAGCHHDTEICQHEVAKAMALCDGGFNVGALVWRHGRLAAESRACGCA